MNVLPTELAGLLLFEPRVFGDNRGFFVETWQASRYRDAGIPDAFVQDNLSRSCRNTLRGLHYQQPHSQGKLVQTLAGEIFDVAVDLRRDSSTFGRWQGFRLNDDNRRQLYVPPGFAHGFCVLSESADVFYKCTDYYHAEHEHTLCWDDPNVGVDWPLTAAPILSDKDRRGKPLSDVAVFE